MDKSTAARQHWVLIQVGLLVKIHVERKLNCIRYMMPQQNPCRFCARADSDIKKRWINVTPGKRLT